MHASKILVATDFSEMSRHAVDYASAQAKTLGARLIIVHACSIPSPDQGEGMLHGGVEHEDVETVERRLKAIKPEIDGVSFEHRLVQGEPASEILRLANEESVGMIVMGTHGNTGLIRVLMGSVAETVVRKAPCPVVTIKVPKSQS